MNIYQRKSAWKWYLAAAGVIILMITIAYTRYLTARLIEREEQQAGQFAESLRQIARTDVDINCDYTLPGKVIQDNTTIPIILLDEANNIELYRNIDDRNLDTMPMPEVKAALQRMVDRGADTIIIDIPPDIHKTLIFSHSNLLKWLRFYPLVQFLLASAFIAFGYMGFNASRKAEQNQVWLGMAKETAHQLGTPITAILGWIETLKAVNDDRPDNIEMIEELRNDVTRLELVADRFSKIGAIPDLTSVNIYDEIEDCRKYMQRRAPRKTVFDFPNPDEHKPLMVNVNGPLFDWVMENLLRNGIDALEGGIGTLSVRVYEEQRFVCIDVSDTGKGIPEANFTTVFKPGFSTKTRGWGLGLSLSKRIIKEYHKGKIFVRKSEIGKGTTFTIKLKKA